jgi:hypothetical protein
MSAVGPDSFGPGADTTADSASGPSVGLRGSEILVVHGYASGTALTTSTDTWNNQSFSTLGLTPGVYTFTLPSDTFTVNIVPEPATLGLLAFAGIAMLRRIPRR